MSLASPANANTAANTADVTAPLEEAGATGASPLGEGDDEFRRLFASWERLDSKNDVDSTPTQSVSVPSAMPLQTSRLTSGYGMRRHPVLGRRRGHKGVDLAAPTGTPIYATADGIVSRANWFSSYGRFISIEHGGEIQTRFAHMSRLAVRSGDRVKNGDLIGYVGSTGRSTGPHLHYEVRIAGKAVNPIPYMKESPIPVPAKITVGHGAMGGAD